MPHLKNRNLNLICSGIQQVINSCKICVYAVFNNILHYDTFLKAPSKKSISKAAYITKKANNV